MTNHALTVGETPRFLVRTHGLSGYAAHIPTSDGDPICKLSLNISLWQIEECPVTPTLLCAHCAAMQTKQARSAVPMKQRSAPPVADDAAHQVVRTSHAALVLASITEQYRYLSSSHPPGHPRKG